MSQAPNPDNDKHNEFSGNYHTGNNHVSQVFKDGGMFNDPRTRNLIAIGVLTIVAIIGGVLYFEEDGGDFESNFLSTDTETPEEGAPTETTPESTPDASGEVVESGDKHAGAHDTQPMQVNPPKEIPGEVTDSSATEAAAGSAEESAPEDTGPAVKPKVIFPAANVQKPYDETALPAEFKWEGTGGTIKFARDPAMKSIVHKFHVKGNSFQYRKFLPGTWYWQVSNKAGASEISSFEVLPPVLRSVALSSPQAGGTLMGNGGVVSWTGDTKVSFYRVEMGDGNWDQVTHKFSTSGTEIAIQNVPAGSYQLRVGAFSEVSGRWEYTQPVAVSVQ